MMNRSLGGRRAALAAGWTAVLMLGFVNPAAAVDAEPVWDDIDLAAVRNPFQSSLPETQTKTRGTDHRREDIDIKQQLLSQPRLDPHLDIDTEYPDAEPSLPELLITGIVWNTRRPQAIINGEVVEAGDRIEEIEIVGINKNGIHVRYQGRELTIAPQRSSP